MMKTYQKIIIWSGVVLVCFGLLAIYIYYGPKIPDSVMTMPETVTNLAPAPTRAREKTAADTVTEPKELPRTVKTILEINGQKYEGEIGGETSVYNFMDKLRDEGRISFTDRPYIGMGKLVVSINGTRSAGDHTWIYYVNGKEAETGVSNYKIKPGDVVSWKYEKLRY